jgi:hypothetical protein
VNALQLIRRWMTPRYVVQTGMLTHDDLERLANARRGDFVELNAHESIHMLPQPPLHIHLAPRRPRRTAAMGPTMRRTGGGWPA